MLSNMPEEEIDLNSLLSNREIGFVNENLPQNKFQDLRNSPVNIL